MLDYFARLPKGKMVLWCYLIWYAVTVWFYFDPSPRIWLNALGLSAIIGFALLLSVSAPSAGRQDRWQTFRLFMMPFGVSSFSQLIKGQGFFLIVPPRLDQLLVAVAAILLFLALVTLVKRWHRPLSPI